MKKECFILYPLLLAVVFTLVFAGALLTPDALLTGDGGVSSVRPPDQGYLSAVQGTWGRDVAPLGSGGLGMWRLPRVRECLLLVGVSPPWAEKLAYLLHTIALALVVYIWLLLRRFSPFVAFCSGVALALAGHSFTIIRAGHEAKFAMFTYVMLGLLCFDQGFTRRKWVLFALAGVAMAQTITTQPDIAIMCGLLVGAYALFRYCMEWSRERTARFAAFGAAGLVLAFTVFLLSGASALLGRYEANVAGVSTGPNNVESEAEAEALRKWEWATQWSLTPEDTLELVAPAVFGLNSASAERPYIGRQGRGAEPGGFKNYRLEGQYMSGLVIAFALLAFLLALRRGGGVDERWRTLRPEIWFWSVAALVSYLLMLGKYAPLYQFFYALPKMSAIRNPLKFIYGFEICIVMLFAIGLQYFMSRQDAVEEK